MFYTRRHLNAVYTIWVVSNYNEVSGKKAVHHLCGEVRSYSSMSVRKFNVFFFETSNDIEHYKLFGKNTKVKQSIRKNRPNRRYKTRVYLFQTSLWYINRVFMRSSLNRQALNLRACAPERIICCQSEDD